MQKSVYRSTVFCKIIRSMNNGFFSKPSNRCYNKSILEEDSSAKFYANRQENAMKEEQCILVNENDQFIGHSSKRECHLWTNIEKNGMLHRAFSAFVFNDKNELLLQKRSKHKLTFPGVWSNTCCSHPLQNLGELQDENEDMVPHCKGVKIAARRKLCQELLAKEEDIPLEKIKFVARVIYKAPCPGTEFGEHEMDYILFLRLSLDTKIFNLEEIEQLEYVNKDRLAKLISTENSNEKYQFSPWFLLIARNFLLKGESWSKIESIDQITDKKIYKL